MGYIIVIIVGIVIIWALYAVSNDSKKKKGQEKLSQSEELKVRIPGTEPVKRPVATQFMGQESLDSVYAKKNNLWICTRCETINHNGLNNCEACGKGRY